MAETESKFNKQLLAALASPNVSNKLATIIKEAIKEAVADSLQNIGKEITDLRATIAVLRTDLQARDVTIAQLRDTNDRLKPIMSHLIHPWRHWTYQLVETTWFFLV